MFGSLPSFCVQLNYLCIYEGHLFQVLNEKQHGLVKGQKAEKSARNDKQNIKSVFESMSILLTKYNMNSKT